MELSHQRGPRFIYTRPGVFWSVKEAPGLSSRGSGVGREASREGIMGGEWWLQEHEVDVPAQ